MTRFTSIAAACCALAAFVTSSAACAAPSDDAAVRTVVDGVIRPLMEAQKIPGMAVGVTIDGRHYVFDYGVASQQTHQPVGTNTLFEIASMSKTFAATLASIAQQQHKLNLDDPISRYVPALRGSRFDDISVKLSGTHMIGLPLFVPDDVATDAQAMQWIRAWQPSQPPGTQRTYSNLGIGLLGTSAAAALGQSYENAVRQRIFAPLGMTNSFYAVPASRQGDYAQGYNSAGKPIRMRDGVFAGPAYGVRTNAGDLLRYLDANLGIGPASALQSAITATHTGYFRTQDFTQDLVWEQYTNPVDLATLKAGNGVLTKTVPATAITPPQAPANDVLINKTGTSNGFGAYMLFVPSRRIGIVMLANRPYPVDARVEAGYRLLEGLR